MSVTAKSVVLDIAHNSQVAKMARSVEFKLGGSLLAVGNGVGFTAYGVQYSATYSVANLFDTTKSKTGVHADNGWQVNNTVPTRLIIVFDSPQEFDELVFNNHHDSGISTQYGIQGVVITASTDEIVNTTYEAAITNATEIFDGTVNLHISSDAIDDQVLWTAPDGNTVIRAYVDMPYSLVADTIRAFVNMPYSLLLDLRGYTEMLYSLRLGSHLDMYYGDSPLLRRLMIMPYGDCPVLRRAMLMKYGDLLMLRHSVDMPYAIPKLLTKVMEMRYSIAESELRGFVDMQYDLLVNNPLRSALVMPYLSHGDGLVKAVGAAVSIGGREVKVHHLAVEPDWGLYAIPAELHIGEADYVRVNIGDEVEIVFEGITYNLIVDDKRESKPSRESVTFVVTALSPAMLLSADFSRPLVSDSAEGYHGTAEALVNELVGDLGPVTWNIDDYPVQPYTVFANDEAPREVIRKIISPVGAILQSGPDGTIRIEYDEPPDWETREPDYYVSWGRDFISQDVTLLKKPGYNRFLVSGQMASERRLWAEQSSISDTVAEVLGFMTPWDAAIPMVLEHSGGDEVAEPEYMGVVEELYPPETEGPEEIEFVAGFAQTRRPIYEQPQVTWLREHLGALTFAEDGRLEAEIKDGDTDGYSLAALRYLTRYHLWRVRDDQAGTVQYLLRRLDDEVNA